MQQKIKILLVQLASNGDCLFATALARQIKEIDHPNCELTWLIGSKFKAVLTNNPHVDHIQTVEINSVADIEQCRATIPSLIKKLDQHYDQVYVTDYCDRNRSHWYGTTRSSIFRSYPHKIKVDVSPVLVLTDQEKNNVREFSILHKLSEATEVILFECSPQSKQSELNFEDAVLISQKITKANKGVKIILSSSQKLSLNDPNIIDASILSWRENSELTHYCSLLVGCSSGITWISTSTASKKLPMIQFLNTHGRASVYWDLKCFDQSTKNLIETIQYSPEFSEKLIQAVLTDGFERTKIKYHKPSTSGELRFFVSMYNSRIPIIGFFIGVIQCFRSVFKIFPFKTSIYYLLQKNTNLIKPST